MDFLNKEENINLSIKNNSNNNPFLLKKILKSNMANKNINKFNISNNNKFSKTKISNKSDYLSKLDINFDKKSFYSNNNGFGNKLLIKVMKNNNTNKKIILKEILKDSNKIININKERMLYNNNSNYNKFKKYFNNKTNSSKKRRISSAYPLILNYNKKYKEINKIIILKNYKNNYYDDIPKILAFKENIFVHEKNISLSENNQDINDIINNNDKIKNTDYINQNKKVKEPKSKINQKFKRPKSAVYRHSKQNNNLMINNLHLNELSLKKQSNNYAEKNFYRPKTDKIDDDYYDLSYANNSQRKMVITQKQKRNNYKMEKEKKNFTSPFEYLLVPSKKLSKFDENFLFETNISNIKDITNNMIFDSKIKDKYKINRGHFFRRRPMSIINEKYLIYLPKDIKKDIKNKYNFFSYLLTENIYYNVGEKKNIIKLKNVKKNKQNKCEIQKNNNIKHNYSEYSIHQNENLNVSGVYKIDCRKEEEFMLYLKKLNYMEKHPIKVKYDNINKININKNKIMKSKANNIYRPVKIKIDNFTCFETQRKENKLNDKKIGSSEEENELCEKIKSQPFLNKRKSKFQVL